MGRKKKWYPARRMLALILAVAMSVTMVPSTAMAASLDDVEAESIDASTPQPNADGGQSVAGENGTATTDDAANVDEGVTNDSTAAGTDGVVVSNDTPSADNTAPDDGAAAAAGSEKTGDAGETNQETTGENDTAANAEGATASAQATYAIDASELETEAVYTGYALFTDLSAVKLQKTVGEKTETLDEYPTASWKVKGGEAVANPVDAGTYELTLSYAAVEGEDGHPEVKTTEPVVCVIAKASLTFEVSAAVTPGTLKEKVKDVLVIDAVTGAGTSLPIEHFTVSMTGMRDAIDNSEIKDGVALKINGDYVMDIKPDFSDKATADEKKNYELPESCTGDVVMGDLTPVTLNVELDSKWETTEPDGSKTRKVTKVYNGKAADKPQAGTDYTYTVTYTDAGGKKVDVPDAEKKISGEWVKWGGDDCLDTNGKVKAPTEAGDYQYCITYKDEDGVYDSDEALIDVMINPAKVSVSIKNDVTKGFSVPAGTVMTKVLSQVNYKAEAESGDPDKRVPIDVKQNHIWGTGYDDSNVSQIYEPAFTLQEKAGTSWKSISDANYKLEAGKEYRVIYDGKKAIYNADGTYAHRTDINSGLDEDGEEINGVNSNYITDDVPTADDKALTVTVEAGVAMKWDVSGLKPSTGISAGNTPETAVAKDYDGVAVYSGEPDYKNKVKLKGEAGKTLPATGKDFRYRWYKNTAAYDLIDKKVMDQNKENGFTTEAFDDAYNWESSSIPKDAGIYKLEISYEDTTDDGTYYYIEDNEPYVKDGKVVLYYVINRIQLTINPKGREGGYTVLSGQTVYNFFEEEDIAYEMLGKDDKDYKIPSSVGELVPEWKVIEETTTEGVTSTNIYWEDSWNAFEVKENAKYYIQVGDIGQWALYEDWKDFLPDDNYTIYEKSITQTDVNGKSQASVKKDIKGGKVELTVKPMGTAKLTVTPKADSLINDEHKVYDGEALTLKEVKPENAYTLTKPDGSSITLEEIGGEYMLREKDGEEICRLEDQRQAGEYNLYVCFWGNEEYAPFDLGENPEGNPGVLIGTVKIKQREIGLSLKLKDTYVAGSMREVESDIELGWTATGCIPDDEWAFVNDEGENAEAWDGGMPVFEIYEEGSKKPCTKLERDKTYIVRYDSKNSMLQDYYDDFDNEINFARNYKVVVTEEQMCSFKTVASLATVTSVSRNGVKALKTVQSAANREKDKVSQTVDVLEGIEYSSYTGTNEYGQPEDMTGNLVAFRIDAPAEFGNIPDAAMYKNEIETAGGKVLSSTANSLTVLFDAAAGTKTFNIRWQDKYVEKITLNFSKDQCLGNLTDAVAPKSLAFNAVPKKLAVGESVQLDVKITKAQMGDVIRLGYESEDPATLYVDPDSGYVTALKKGKAKISVYPMHMNAEGKTEKISGSKSASVVIEATSVTAPKPVKVSAHGKYVDVNYGVVPDGYRREIYVVDTTKNPSLKTASAIENKVKEIQGIKNQWKDSFAIAPIYLDSADESYNRYLSKDNATGQYTQRLSGLKVNNQYAIYVRNVCEAKTVPGVGVITQSAVDASAAGTVASCRTLKSEVTALDLKLDETLDGIKDITEYYEDEVPEFYEYIRSYEVEFSKHSKGLKTEAFGKFMLEDKDAAWSNDATIILPLPLKQDTNIYQAPKLEYYVWGLKNAKTNEYGYVKKNDLVSIDKSGKIKLTGTGYASIYVKDTSLGETAEINLHIVANVDSVTAKKKSYNMAVGEEMYLNSRSLYTYKTGKTKLTNYDYPDMDMNAVRNAINAQKQNDYFELDNGALIAIKGGGTLKLSLTDKNVLKNADPVKNATVEITFKSTALQPVKNVKAIDVTNNKFGLTFVHTGEANAFRVEITDASKRKIHDRQYSLCRYGHNDSETYTVHELWRVSGGKNQRVKDTYVIDSWEIQKYVKLAKESQYTVTVTALYNGVASKAATGKVKTTKIPATEGYLEDYEDENGNVVINPKGGMSISISEGQYELNNNRLTLRALSGNSYTLTANLSNRGRVNDTLVWTIGDKKVASVKAAAGTYCITLKGLKPGDTVLEVKSKILGNKVIARYNIVVVPVGNAYGSGYSNPRYYGDNEPENWTNPSNQGSIPDAQVEYLPLSVGDQRKVSSQSKYDYLRFSFKVPESGRYNFYLGKSIGFKKKVNKTDSGTYLSGSNEKDLGWLTEGDTVYLESASYVKETNPFYVCVNLTQRMEQATNGMTVTGQYREEYLEFKAPETGYYQFTLSFGNNSSQNLYLYESFADATSGGYNTIDSGVNPECILAKDESVYVKTDDLPNEQYTLNVTKISEEAAVGTPKEVSLAAGETKYLMLTMEKAGYFQFAVAPKTGETVNNDVSGEISVGSNLVDYIYSTEFTKNMDLQKDDAVCLKLTNSGSAAATFIVTATDKTPGDLPATGDTAIPGGESVMYQFTASKAGVYKFTAAVEGTGTTSGLKIWSSVGDIDNLEAPLAQSSIAETVDGKSVYTVGIFLEASQTVYIQMENTSSGQDMNVKMTGAEDIMDEIKASGTNIAVTASQKKTAVFTANAAGVYAFTTDSLTETVNFALYKNDAYLSDNSWADDTEEVYSNNSLLKKVFLREGQTVVWVMTADSDVSVSMSAALQELTLDKSSARASMSSGDADGFIFTAPEAGYYSFWSDGKGDDTYGILYDINEMSVETSLLNNRDNTGKLVADDGSADSVTENDDFGISCELRQDQTVYLKCMYYSSSDGGSYDVFVEQGKKFNNN